MAAAWLAFDYLPRETLAAGSREVAGWNVPGVSDMAATDVYAADQLWLAVNGDELGLTTKQRIDAVGEGYIALANEAAAIYSIATLAYAAKDTLQAVTQTPERTAASPPRGANNSTVRNSLNTADAVHYDQLNGGTGVGGPTQLQQRYPNTQFQFARRGQAGVDVTYVGKTHPSAYPDSNWPAGFNHGDFKPNTPSGARTFYTQLNSGKLPVDTVPLPYDPQSKTLLQNYFFGP
jgi:hypothetical protein